LQPAVSAKTVDRDGSRSKRLPTAHNNRTSTGLAPTAESRYLLTS